MLQTTASFAFKFNKEVFDVKIDVSIYGDGSPSARTEVEIISTTYRYTHSVLQNTGVARCSIGDEFTMSTGMRLAFTRALRYMPKEFRTKAWEAMNDYLEDHVINSSMEQSLHELWEKIRSEKEEKDN